MQISIRALKAAFIAILLGGTLGLVACSRPTEVPPVDQAPPGPLITDEADPDAAYPPQYPTMRPSPEGYVPPEAQGTAGEDSDDTGATGEITDTSEITATDSMTATGTVTATGTITP